MSWDLNEFIVNIISTMIIFPAAFLCFVPVRSHLKYSKTATTRNTLVTIIVVVLINAAVKTLFNITGDTTSPIILIILFLIYSIHIGSNTGKKLTVFAWTTAYMSFINLTSIGFDATLNPFSTLNNYSMQAGIFKLVLSILFVIAAYFPVFRYGTELIESPTDNKVWNISGITLIVLLFIISMLQIRYYNTLHTNRISRVYWGMIVLLFILLTLLTIVFYLIFQNMTKYMYAREQNQLYEMQKEQYNIQQRYINEIRRTVHDFKHTTNMLYQLIQSGDIYAAKEYLEEYTSSIPASEIKSYCDNNALNALLNHYHILARQIHIDFQLSVTMTSASTTIPDIDLCSIIGNVLENSINACNELTVQDKYIDLAVIEENNYLYIVTTNSYSGKLNQSGDKLLSSHGSTGIGLSSIEATAHRLNGSATFTYDDNEFNSNIMIPISTK